MPLKNQSDLQKSEVARKESFGAPLSGITNWRNLILANADIWLFCFKKNVFDLYLNDLSARARPEEIDNVLPVPAESVCGNTVGSALAVTIELTDEL